MDVKQVLELWRRAGAEPSVTDDPGALRRRLRRDRNLFVLAWDRGRLVGTLIGGWDGWRGHLYRLAVDRPVAGRGRHGGSWSRSRSACEGSARGGSTESS